MPAEPLTADETKKLAGLMLDLAEQGAHDTAEELGQLAHDPAAVREVLAGVEKYGDAPPG